MKILKFIPAFLFGVVFGVSLSVDEVSLIKDRSDALLFMTICVVVAFVIAYILKIQSDKLRHTNKN